MSMMTARICHLAKLTAVVTAVLLAASATDSAWAQGGLLGSPHSQAAASGYPIGGVVGWLLAKQAEFYRQFSGLIRAAKADGSAVWSLVAFSFLYGIFHAAGPGHGKAVISSYLVANEETWVRGIVLSFVSALLQAVVAVAVVGISAALLNASAAAMNSALNAIETTGYAIIIVIGGRLLWVKGRGFVTAWRELNGGKHAEHHAIAPAEVALADHPHGHDHREHNHHGHHCHAHEHHKHNHGQHPAAGHSHDRDQHGHGHSQHGHDHNHDHDDASAWGHAHAPEPEELAGPGGWARGLSAIVAVGLRPCSGAILVLVFALAQGLFWVGVTSAFAMAAGTFLTVAGIATIAVGASAWAKRLASSGSGYGMLTVRGAEAGAALLITAFGILLLCGYMVNERMVGF
jgi:nickel/cobalt exporter